MNKQRHFKLTLEIPSCAYFDGDEQVFELLGATIPVLVNDVGIGMITEEQAKHLWHTLTYTLVQIYDPGRTCGFCEKVPYGK